MYMEEELYLHAKKDEESMPKDSSQSFRKKVYSRTNTSAIWSFKEKLPPITCWRRTTLWKEV